MPNTTGAPRAAPANDRVKQTVLVVDDEPDILSSIEVFLEGSLDGVEVETATSGKQALAFMEENTVDLILADFRMPGMNGLEFLAEARERRSRIPRILMTAFPDLDLAVDAINEERVERFFTKPLDPLQVVDTVQQILSSQRQDAMRKQAYARALHMLRERESDGSGAGDAAEA